MPSDSEVLHLQEMLLEAVVLGKALPGQSQPIRFPDLSFVMRQIVVFLSNENLSGQMLLRELQKPIRILPVDAIFQEAHNSGDITYLQFQPPEVMNDAVHLTLEAKIATRNPNQQTLGLSSIHVKFLKVAEEWKLLDEPIYSAV